jgi:hypothetical protein
MLQAFATLERMPRNLDDIPRIGPECIPNPLYHGTNKGDLIRASTIRASHANAGGRGIHQMIWFFADEEAAFRYCTAHSMDGPHGWGLPEVLIYRYCGTRPILDLRGFERDDVLQAIGDSTFSEAIEQAAGAGVLIHSTTTIEHDEWGFASAADLKYIEAKRPTDEWFARKQEDERAHEIYCAKLQERRGAEEELEAKLVELRKRHRCK